MTADESGTGPVMAGRTTRPAVALPALLGHKEIPESKESQEFKVRRASRAYLEVRVRKENPDRKEHPEIKDLKARQERKEFRVLPVLLVAKVRRA